MSKIQKSTTATGKLIISIIVPLLERLEARKGSMEMDSAITHEELIGFCEAIDITYELIREIEEKTGVETFTEFLK